MISIKKTVAPVGRFVSDHRVAIAVVVTLTVCTMISMANTKITNDFLMEHDLLDEFLVYEGK